MTEIVAHIYLADAAENPLRCDHPEGKVSFRIISVPGNQVWITGTPAEIQQFAAYLSSLVSQ